MIFSDEELDGNQFVCFANKPALCGISKRTAAGGIHEASDIQRPGSKY
jgi:hypothetical protein